MSRKEPAAGPVQAAVAGKITTAEGAHALEISLRQFRRLKARYRAEGVRGLVHRHRGRPSPRRLDVEIRDRVAELVQTTYRDFNDCHATETLRGSRPGRQPQYRPPASPDPGPAAQAPAPAAAAPRPPPAPSRLGALVLVDAASSTGSAPAPASSSSAPSTTRRAPSWPSTSAPPKTCTLSHPAGRLAARDGCP